VPVVELWDASDAAIDSVVGMDHRAIGRLQAEHLMAQGCRRLAFVAAIRPHDYRAQKRLDGARQAVRERLGRDVIEHTAPTGGSPDLGDRLVDELLQREPGIDGIVCNSDLLAFGVLRGLHRLGRRVPDDVAVIGFGDNEAGSCLRPSLSTVRPPRAEIGRLAAEVILARLDHQPPLRHRLAAELIVRDSTTRKMRGGGRKRS
jgi:LacI family gluconate utilization system Gnt-I transcriptional repressor